MNWIENSWSKSLGYAGSKSKARWFALILVAAPWIWFALRWNEYATIPVALIVYTAYPILCLILPVLIKPLLIIWLFIGGLLGEISSFVLLIVVYFLLAWPLKIFIRKRTKAGWYLPDEEETDYQNPY